MVRRVLAGPRGSTIEIYEGQDRDAARLLGTAENVDFRQFARELEAIATKRGHDFVCEDEVGGGDLK